MAGMIETVSVSATGVSRSFKKRMSSSLWKTLTEREAVAEWPRWPGFLTSGVGATGLLGALFLHGLANLCFFGTGCRTDWQYETPAIGVAIASVVVILAGVSWACIAHNHNNEATS